MKKTAIILASLFGVLVLAAVVLHALPIKGHSHLPDFKTLHGESQNSDPLTNNTSITIKLNEPQFAVCGQRFFDSVYELTKAVFVVGADNVVLSEYENKMFDLIRHSEEFKDDPQAFIDHIKAIPGQTIDIVKEDPKVLDSCENFQVSMVGPP